MSDIKLPPLPRFPRHVIYDGHGSGEPLYSSMQCDARCNAAVLADRAARAETVIAWATHHDEAMFFPTRAEALQYCDEGEAPIALVAAPTQEHTPAPTLGDPS